MKRILLILMASFLFVGANAQVTAKAEGNKLIQQPDIKTLDQIVGNATKTDQVFVSTAGDEYPVYKASDNSLFIARKSKSTGGYYKQKIKVQ